ncbi:large-conductance mechanosensitive channel protein MscL [Tannerella serpentiformis]|jgi:large conductance mechanosensitive channel protein|uniref:Large-conductance mechanosensitive channel n=1 Tax=Tannerella sp. oral taxon BU063 isolate Cell 1/3 TaxID=1411022 RepID=W2CPW2_9BACT|nr:large-conductance mechanosensitive channel protein MscL [Tannerella serpentiformis]AOH40112.1 large-conductance mechanosensitive channel protein MscL [Tannerella serpentiformis]AVV53999.1 large-conductance mechanosensitive channel protein MscL [Tannerella serpentiformis]ETK09269.1 large conductance mechanosensitive channel protein MscL [Tannerella sp. oral taxon BU063 isolate Cell 1/3]
MGLIKEFKEFAMRGNVLDMAVGIVIGGAFGKIVSSFVEDILMPPIGVLLGGVNFTDLKIVFKQAVMDGENVVTPEVALRYGNFIQVIFDFLIIAFAIFMLLKAVNKFNKKKEEAPAAPEAPPADVQLLTEIRDLLQKKN